MTHHLHSRDKRAAPGKAMAARIKVDQLLGHHPDEDIDTPDGRVVGVDRDGFILAWNADTGTAENAGDLAP